MDKSTERVAEAEAPSTEDEPPLLKSPKSPPVFRMSERKALSPRLLSMMRSSQWEDWRWQLRNRIRSMARLSDYLPAVEVSPWAFKAAEKFPLAITPYYASLVRTSAPSDPVLMMSVPRGKELRNPPFLRDDPLDEDRHMPIPGLVHRYADRALFLATSACAMYCRHCTRKRMTGARETFVSASRMKRTTEYLAKHPEIREVIVSGGDPLTMSDDHIESVVAALRAVPSVDVIRIGTRTPVTLPFRITDELTRRLRKHHPIWINTHFNHPNEITPESIAACGRLADAGFPIGNQSVLLKGINDDPRVMEELLRGLIRMRVRPYYLFQCDLVAGIEHFRTPLSRGIEIMERLRGSLSGIAVPTFVVDLPRGGGKVPLLPDYVVSRSPSETVLRNYEGVPVSYPEPIAEEACLPGPSAENAGRRERRRPQTC